VQVPAVAELTTDTQRTVSIDALLLLAETADQAHIALLSDVEFPDRT